MVPVNRYRVTAPNMQAIEFDADQWQWGDNKSTFYRNGELVAVVWRGDGVAIVRVWDGPSS